MEEFFEPLFRFMRVSKIRPFVKRGVILCDIGCGVKPNLLIDLSSVVKSGFGVDKKVSSVGLPSNIFVKRFMVSNRLLFDSSFFNVITMLAVLEHLSDPFRVLTECFRVLKKGGLLLVTVPSCYSKPLLDFFSSVNLVSRVEILDHKNYWSKSSLVDLIKSAGFTIVKSSYYNLFFNIFIVAKKL